MTTGDAHAPTVPEEGPADRRGRTPAGVVLLIAAPTIWLLHLLVSYAVVPWSCRIGSDMPLYGVTIVAAIVTAVVTVATVRGVRSTGRGSWRTVVLDEPAPPAPDDRRTVFLLAACLGAYFAVLVLMMALVAPIVDRCA